MDRYLSKTPERLEGSYLTNTLKLRKYGKELLYGPYEVTYVSIGLVAYYVPIVRTDAPYASYIRYAQRKQDRKLGGLRIEGFSIYYDGRRALAI